jgi:hypothetical protein
MISIKIPNNNINERKYIIDIIFNEFLGLNYKIEINNDLKDYEIILQNDKILTIEDTFFNKFPKDLEYLKLENIPNKIEELDIFASSFFMLSRWEEYVNKNRDSHDRFPAAESLAFKQGFLDRPIVNEHIEDLKKQLLNLDSSLVFKEKNFEMFLTHDVDELVMWKSWRHVFRVVAGDILKRRDIKLALQRFAEYFLIKQGNIKDPFDTFDWLMDKSESIGIKSRFYFMSGGVTEYDNRYKIDDEKTIKLMQHIKNRGHIIGFHPSYNAYNDIIQFTKEKDVLESASKCEILEGREHYLRFEVPTTWQIWEDNGMKIDSTCGYADKEGFRCGTGDEYSVFNILTREKLKLKERPLIFMDDNHYSYNQNIDTKNSFDIVINLIKQAKQYNSKVTLLFHNSIFINNKKVDFFKLNTQLLELAK